MVRPLASAFFGGDHHIHAAGCALPPRLPGEINPEDVFVQVKGEGLNIGFHPHLGAVLRLSAPMFLRASAHELSEPPDGREG